MCDVLLCFEGFDRLANELLSCHTLGLNVFDLRVLGCPVLCLLFLLVDFRLNQLIKVAWTMSVDKVIFQDFTR